MLHDARMKIAHRPVDGFTSEVDSGVAQVPIPRDEAPHAGYRKTALPAFLHFCLRRA